jgi:DNA (cytosine-5)-methyltransferase 1
VSEEIPDLFAGPGGWEVGAKLAGYRGGILGIDISPDACATARAAGHAREQTDVRAYPLRRFAGCDGVLNSAPCTDHTIAGLRRGVRGESGALILEGLRWVMELRPRWTAWECTPDRSVLLTYEKDAAVMREAGYSTWVGVLNAVDYGVPQTRRRAVLIARRDGIPAAPPPPIMPRNMAEALGWSGAVLVSNYGTGGDPAKRGRRSMDQPSFTMTGKCGRNKWEWPDGTRRNLTVEEAGVLQTFPADYPWEGGSTSRQQQVGDAVPPWLAAKIIETVMGEQREEVAA